MQASVTLGLDSGPFAAGIAQAESKARSFSGRLKGLIGGGAGRSPWDDFTAPIPNAQRKVEGLSSSIAGLFRRTPERRAELALSRFAGGLATGNIAGAVTGLGESITGFGLLAGVAVGAAAVAFQKFEGQIKETKKAFDSLSTELSKPLSLQSGLGPEGISKELESVTKDTDELVKKRNTVSGYLIHQFARGRDDISEKITAGFERQKELATARADAELETSAIKKESLSGDEGAAAIAKIDLETQKKINALYLERSLTKPGRSAVDLFKSVAAATQEGRAEKKAAEDQFALKDQEEEAQRRILDIQSQNLDKEHESLAVIREKIELLEEERAAGVTTQRGSAIDTAIKRLGAEAAATAREKVAAGAQDVNLTNEEFQGEAFRDYQKRRAESATARAEQGQLAFETKGRALTTDEQARFNEFQTEGNAGRGNLLAERRGLMREQGLSQETMELSQGTQSEQYGGGLGTLGYAKYLQRQQRIGDIDKALGKSSEKGGPATKEDIQSALEAVAAKYLN